MDLSLLVDADDPVVADLLVGTLDLLLEAGGGIDPHARLIARDGDLSVASSSGDGTSLLTVPPDSWVRVDRFAWTGDGDRLGVAAVPDDAGDIEIQMAYLQTALHNQCGKLGWLSRTHPSLAPLPERVIDAVRAVVPSFRNDPLNAVDVLWSNRCFRMPLDDARAPERVLTPVVDLLNHRRGGATGTVSAGAFTVEVRHPFTDDECALDYGLDRDAMELAVVYGFVDDSADVAHSAPLSLDGVSLPRVSFRANGMDAAVSAVQQHTGADVTEARAMVAEAAAVNVALLDTLLEAAAPISSPASVVLADAARHQRAVILRTAS